MRRRTETYSVSPTGGEKLKFLRNAGLSSRAASPGVRCGGLSCDATHRSHFPPTEEGVLARPSFLAPGRTCATNRVYLDKACALNGLDFKWLPKRVLIAVDSLSKAGDRSFSPKPALASRQLLRVASQKGLRNEFALKTLIRWTFLLRVEAGCLPPVKQQAGNRCLGGDRLLRRAALGLEGGKFVIKLNQ